MSSAGASSSVRPAAPKRNSSQGLVSRGILRSPGSELDIQQLRHQVRPKGHARIVLPRNHSSGRNLAKLARQVAAEGNKTHGRQRSHEGDTEIRLPGSLDESEKPPIRRNYTASNLPRNSSHTKLKKNLSHGHLQRLGSTKDLLPLTSTAKSKTPLSPGLKGKSKRPRSMDWDLDKDLHTREVELGLQQEQDKREGPRKVGFAVGSVGDADNADEIPAMEGSGLDEGEWTEESASVSPYSTRQNTANNSRRQSVHEQPAVPTILANETSSETETETEETSRSLSPRSKKPVQGIASALSAATGVSNPTTQLLRGSSQIIAPALISNVNVMDDTHSMRTSPAASLQSQLAGSAQASDPDELVSRFVASASTGSGTTTTMQNTPKSGSFNTPDDATFARHRNGFSLGPVSPGSTVSAGSSGATTPAMGRSRIELRMLQEKAQAEMEINAERHPLVPAHVYDRRNESLKSYLHLAALNSNGLAPSGMPISLGPEIFQGRFKAVNTELKVVQMFKDPVAESLNRLRARQSRLGSRPSSQKKESSLRMSKSAVTLPVRTAKKESSTLSTSSTPPQEDVTPSTSVTSKPTLTAAKSSLVIKPGRRAPTRGVSFAGADEHREFERDDGEPSLDDLAKEMWESVMT